MRFDADWIVPQWPVAAHVRSVCTTRAGGGSSAPYDSLNLGDHVGDSPPTVAHNRLAFAQAIGTRPVFLKQVHGTRVVRLRTDTPDGVEADGCYATSSGVACTMMVADCLPILFAHRNGAFVAAAHAGWRGLAGRNGRGILESLWEDLSRDIGAQADETLVWLGPCIGPDAFEVGPDVRAAFEANDPEAAAMFRANGQGKWLADLPQLARRRLRKLGMAGIYGNDGGAAWCTVRNPSRFFSHRRDRVSGRFAASVWLA